MPSLLAEPATGSRARTRLWSWWPWAVGAAAGLVVLGPALGPGALFNLDLVLTPVVPVPPGVWGLGPELPRRLPFMLPVAWLSTVVDGAAVGKALLVGVFVLAFVGAQRLVGDHGVATRLAAGLLYATSPFLLTRVATGYLGVALMMAVLPWVLPRLVVPSSSLRRTLLASAALGACGVTGGMVAAVVVAAGLLSERKRRLVAVTGALFVGQLPWLVPGVVVYVQGVKPAAAGDFATHATGVGGPLRLLAGHGFWQDAFQVGHGSFGVAVLGAALLGLAVHGHQDLPSAWRRPVGWLALIGVVVALASVVPGLRAVYADLASSPVGAPLREGHRLLPLYLVWMAPAAALGARRLALTTTGPRRVAVLAAPIVVSLWLVTPGLWGIGGQLRPVIIPAEWAQARERVRAQPGAVASLPWAQYFNLNVADGRRVNDVMPLYLGGDVLVASDPHLALPAQERADPREPTMDLLALRVRAEQPVARQLADLGVRWVVLQHDIDWQTYLSLRDDPGLDLVVDGRTLELFEVTGWHGPVVTDAGRALPVDGPVAPVADVPGSGPATWARPGARGWLRGWVPAGIAADGQVRLPGGAGVLWYWPTLLVLVGDAVYLIAIAIATTRELRGLPPPTH